MTAVDPAVMVGDVTAAIVRRPYRRRGCIWAAICSTSKRRAAHAAALAGWAVLRVTASMIDAGTAINLIARALHLPTPGATP